MGGGDEGNRTPDLRVANANDKISACLCYFENECVTAINYWMNLSQYNFYCVLCCFEE